MAEKSSDSQQNYVTASVERYLKNTFTMPIQSHLLDKKRYAVVMDYPVNITHRKADVALLADDKLIVIVVSYGLVGHKDTGEIFTLETYLMATNAPFGIFADSVTPDKWTYLQRKQGNTKELTRQSFEILIREITPSVKKRSVPQQLTPTIQHSVKPKTENEIREIVQQTLQRIVSSPNIQVSNFVPQWNFVKEYTIQFGRERIGRADLVLLLNKKPFVIAECKRQGVVGKGKEQLESYLYASPAHFGIFANDSDPANWTYYAYTGLRRFDEINSDTFNRKVRTQHDTEYNIEAQAHQQKQQRIETRANELVTLKVIQETADTIIQTEAQKLVTENAIQDTVQSQLKTEIKALQNEIKRLKEEHRERMGCAAVGWILFGITIFILIAVANS